MFLINLNLPEKKVIAKVDQGKEKDLSLFLQAILEKNVGKKNLKETHLQKSI